MKRILCSVILMSVLIISVICAEDQTPTIETTKVITSKSIKMDWENIKSDFLEFYFSVRLKDQERVIYYNKKIRTDLAALKDHHGSIYKKPNTAINDGITIFNALSTEFEATYSSSSYGKKIGNVLKMKNEISRIGGQIKKLEPLKK